MPEFFGLRLKVMLPSNARVQCTSGLIKIHNCGVIRDLNKVRAEKSDQVMREFLGL